MKPEVADLLKKERKRQRDLQELMDLQEKLNRHVKPDTKLLKDIQEEIDKLNKGIT